MLTLYSEKREIYINNSSIDKGHNRTETPVFYKYINSLGSLSEKSNLILIAKTK